MNYWQDILGTTSQSKIAILIFSSGFIAGATIFSAIWYSKQRKAKKKRQKDESRYMYIVRHGESMGNVDLDAYREYGDHRLPLTKNGKHMARQSGEFLAKEFESKFSEEEDPWVEMWVSPFTRTRETAIAMLEGGLGKWVKKVSESPHLVEQDWGLLEGMNIEADDVYDRFPESMKRVRLQADTDGKFYARLPQGESVADVYSRVTNFVGSVSRRKLKYTIIVTHGITGRALIMRIFRHTPEWFESSVNLPNASIYSITKLPDANGNFEWNGEFIYGGFGKKGIKDEVDIARLNMVNDTCSLRSLSAAVKYEEYLHEPGVPGVFDNVRRPTLRSIGSVSSSSSSTSEEILPRTTSRF